MRASSPAFSPAREPRTEINLHPKTHGRYCWDGVLDRDDISRLGIPAALHSTPPGPAGRYSLREFWPALVRTDACPPRHLRPGPVCILYFPVEPKKDVNRRDVPPMKAPKKHPSVVRFARGCAVLSLVRCERQIMNVVAFFASVSSLLHTTAQRWSSLCFPQSFTVFHLV